LWWFFFAVSEKKSSSTSTLKKEGSRFFRNVSSHLPNNVVSQRRKPPWEFLMPFN
jgi:hypothetical protein